MACTARKHGTPQINTAEQFGNETISSRVTTAAQPRIYMLLFVVLGAFSIGGSTTNEKSPLPQRFWGKKVTNRQLIIVSTVGSVLVPVAGVEPAPCCQDWILSPARLPIPSHRRVTIITHFARFCNIKFSLFPTLLRILFFSASFSRFFLKKRAESCILI